MSVSCECCVLSGRGRAGPSSRGVLPSEVCPERDCKASKLRRPWPTRGCRAMGKKNSFRKF
jgi:hypothetical protein